MVIEMSKKYEVAIKGTMAANIVIKLRCFAYVHICTDIQIFARNNNVAGLLLWLKVALI